MRLLPIFFSGLFWVSASAVANATCDNRLVLDCQASFADNARILSASAQFADENWDEPSLANCAASLYFEIEDDRGPIPDGDGRIQNTILRIRAQSPTRVDAQAIQNGLRTVHGVTYSYAYYSKNHPDVASSDGHFRFDALDFKMPMQFGGMLTTQAQVDCSVR